MKCQLSEIQLPSATRCPIDHLDRHLHCKAENARDRGTGRGKILTRFLGLFFDEPLSRRKAAFERMTTAYPQASISNEFVHDGYEATFGTYELDKGKQQLAYHVAGSATREKLVGQTETLHYEFPDSRHMIVSPTQPDQHWSVVWERY
jgi:hypothetical protein